MSADELPFDYEKPPLRTFKANNGTLTALAVVAVLTGMSFPLAIHPGGRLLLIGAGCIAAVGLALFVKRNLKKPVRLNQVENGLEVVFRNKTLVIPMDCLIGYASQWTDIYYKGIYQRTRVRLEFHVDQQDEPIAFLTVASKESMTFDELHQLQEDVSAAIELRLLAHLRERRFRVVDGPSDFAVQRSGIHPKRKVRT